MPTIKYVYIAGPYAKPDPVVNTRNAILAGEAVRAMGLVPFVPHLNHLWHLVVPHEPDYWYALDLAWLDLCDVLLRLPGESEGADVEVGWAVDDDIPVVYSLDELRQMVGG